jgi:hypothetical protein
VLRRGRRYGAGPIVIARNDRMRRWNPHPSPGRWICLALLLAALAGAGLAAVRLARALAGPPDTWPVNLALYGWLLVFLGLAVLVVALAYRFAAALTLRYDLDRNGLYISWLGNRAVIPLAQVESVDLGTAIGPLPLGPLQAIGYYWGRARAPGGRVAHLFSTQPPQRSLAIYTPGAAYVIAPADPGAFVQDLEQRRNLGATQALQPTLGASRMVFARLWSDRLARWLLLLALGLNLALLGVIAARYPALAPMIEMRFNAVGEVAEIWPRHQILLLPLAALGLTALNAGLGLLLFQRHPPGARLLQGASVVVQVLFGIAVITIIR